MDLIPRGYRFILFLAFDLDVDSAERLRGEELVSLSRGRFTERIGLKKVLDVLDRFSLKATFFVPGWVAERYTHLVSEIKKRGHEIAAHGYMHERFDELNYYEELAVFKKMIETLNKATGERPRGFRAPYWKFSSYTSNNIADSNFLYDSSLMDDEKPYIIEIKGKKVVELPVDWRLDDWVYLETNRCITPENLLKMWLEELEYASEVSGYIALTFHPQCIGRGVRIRVLEKIIENAKRLKAWMPRGWELTNKILKNEYGGGAPTW